MEKLCCKMIFHLFLLLNIDEERVYRNFPNKRPGRLLTQHPCRGGAYLGQMTFLLYKNAKMAQKWGRLFGQGRLFGRGRLFGKIRYVYKSLL